MILGNYRFILQRDNSARCVKRYKRPMRARPEGSASL